MLDMTSGMDSGAAVRKVNDALHGPVVEILSQYVPELRKLPAEQAYERTLDDIGLLRRCFAAFRDHRDSFKYVLVDAQRQPVTDDKAVLSCGRNLEQVVAMIVRTAAKRYFRRKLNPTGHRPVINARVHDEVHAKGFVHRVAALFHEEPKAKPTHVAEPPRSKADELYDAIKANLLHEWQVPLVPTYADMTPNLVRALGAKLLDIREVEELKKIAADPAEAARLFDIPDAGAAEAAPAAASAGRRDERARLSDVLSPDGKRLNPEAFSNALLRPDVRAQLGQGQTLKPMETLRGVGAMPAKLLVAELGLRVDQLAVLLLVAHELAGPDMFARIFGQPGDAELVMRLTQRARMEGLAQKSTLPEVTAFARRLFTRR